MKDKYGVEIHVGDKAKSIYGYREGQTFEVMRIRAERINVKFDADGKIGTKYPLNSKIIENVDVNEIV